MSHSMMWVDVRDLHVTCSFEPYRGRCGATAVSAVRTGQGNYLYRCVAHEGIERVVHAPSTTTVPRVMLEWTFFGHWNDADELELEYYSPGRQEDQRIDAGFWAGGLFCDSGQGEDPMLVWADVKREYETARTEGEA